MAESSLIRLERGEIRNGGIRNWEDARERELRITNYKFHFTVFLGMPGYRLDRTAFKAQTATEAADHASYYKTLDWKERLRIAFYLNSVAFNYPENCPPRLDKTKFKASARNF